MDVLDRLVTAVEVLVSVGLVAMAVGGIWELGLEIVRAGGNGMALASSDFNNLIGTVLEVFIIVELFRIADAYMRHRNVIPTVLEAALVAVARKFVVFEGAANYLQYAAGLAVLLLAVAVSWYLLEKSDVCRLQQ